MESLGLWSGELPICPTIIRRSSRSSCRALLASSVNSASVGTGMTGDMPDAHAGDDGGPSLGGDEDGGSSRGGDDVGASFGGDDVGPNFGERVVMATQLGV